LEPTAIFHSSQAPWRRAGAAGAHLALWAGFYITGAVVFIAQLTGLDANVPLRTRGVVGAFAFCTAMAVYLLDRVKLRDRWLDPADAQAHPDRFAFLSRHAAYVRVLALSLLAVAGALGTLLRFWGAVIPILAVLGVLLYAGRPRQGRPRPKDIILLKNAYVAAGITGFAALVLMISFPPGDGAGALTTPVHRAAVPLLLACAFLGARVFADAVVCDLDDEDSDRRHGTGTLPTHLGRSRAWNIAMVTRLVSAAMLTVVPVFPWHARLAWAGVTIVSSVALRVADPIRVRDWVDARLPVEAIIVAGVLSAW
jgi:4-hydroxybenzoate polyprenyltransferase